MTIFTIILQVSDNLAPTIDPNKELIKNILANITYFIAFLVILNIVGKKTKRQIEDIERNTEYMKQDFRLVKQELEQNREKWASLNTQVDINKIVYQMLYETSTISSNEFITIKKNSLQLSSLGYVVSIEIGLDEMISSNWNKILPYINDNISHYSQHPYDIEKYCLYLGSCIDQFFQPEQIKILKHYAFEEGHLLTSYFAIIGIIIKKKYFKENNIVTNKLIRKKETK